MEKFIVTMKTHQTFSKLKMTLTLLSACKIVETESKKFESDKTKKFASYYLSIKSVYLPQSVRLTQKRALLSRNPPKSFADVSSYLLCQST